MAIGTTNETTAWTSASKLTITITFKSRPTSMELAFTTITSTIIRWLITWMANRTRSEWVTTASDATLFTLAIINFKSRVVSLIISPWVAARRGCTLMWVMMFQLRKAATTWIRKPVALSSHALFQGKQMHTSGSRCTRIRGLFTTCKVRNKRTWT